MNTAFDFIKANPIFHLASVDGNLPRVRPFSTIMKRKERLYFCTCKDKKVYHQLVKNPNIEISVMGSSGKWIRVQGKIAFDESHEAKKQVFEENPSLLKMYPKGADDELFVTFYFTEAKATLYAYAEAPKSIALF
jgi:uncharacterized pyridoxamine 5'-phosphate oxidase family protein